MPEAMQLRKSFVWTQSLWLLNGIVRIDMVGVKLKLDECFLVSGFKWLEDMLQNHSPTAACEISQLSMFSIYFLFNQEINWKYAIFDVPRSAQKISLKQRLSEIVYHYSIA